MIIDLIYNLAVLVSLSVVSGYVGERYGYRLVGKVLQGVLFGCIAIIGMLRPFHFSPGIFFDGRSVMISLCALFFGPLAGIISGVFTGCLRIYQGGAGTLTGVMVILSSLLLGSIGFTLRDRRIFKISCLSLLAFGLLVNGTMVLLMFSLPGGVATTVITKITIPVLVLFSLATVFSGTIIYNTIARNDSIDDLKKSELKFRGYIDNSPDGVFVVDNKGRYLEVNRAAVAISGLSRQELLSRKISKAFLEISSETGKSYFDTLIENGSAKGEFIFTPRGESRWLSIDAVKLSDDRCLGFVKDVTERKEAEKKIRLLLDEKDILLKEVHHRIKNNMTSIKGLLSLQISAEKNSSARESLKNAENRVQTLITLYSRLYCTDNYRELSINTYLCPLATDIIKSFQNNSNMLLNLDVEDLNLNIQLLTPLGIIVNEVLSNIMKHAFIGLDKGVIWLSFSLQKKTARLIIQDNGIGIPASVDFENPIGFGMQIVRMLVEQLGGEIIIKRDNGTKFILEFTV